MCSMKARVEPVVDLAISKSRCSVALTFIARFPLRLQGGPRQVSSRFPDCTTVAGACRPRRRMPRSLRCPTRKASAMMRSGLASTSLSRGARAGRRSGGRSAGTPGPASRTCSCRRSPSPRRRAGEVEAPRSVSTVMSQVCGPVCRQSSSRLDREALRPRSSPPRRRSGSARSPASTSRAESTVNGPGRISVRIERALIPGSKTPKPPGCHIQAWFGCQWRTSSFQTIATLRTPCAASHAFARATPGAKRECQVAKRTAPRRGRRRPCGRPRRAVAAGGFSSRTSRPAASAFSAIAVRDLGRDAEGDGGLAAPRRGRRRGRGSSARRRSSHAARRQPRG